MKKKRHPMQAPRTIGDVFAVEIASEAWAYCRMINGSGVEIISIFSRTPGFPEIDWTSPKLKRWLFRFWSEVRKGDPLIIPVGNVPFASEAEVEMPPTYRDPDNIEPRYTIEYRGKFTYTDDPADLKGIAKEVTLTPSTLRSFLKEQYDNGILQEIKVKSKA